MPCHWRAKEVDCPHCFFRSFFLVFSAVVFSSGRSTTAKEVKTPPTLMENAECNRKLLAEETSFGRLVKENGLLEGKFRLEIE